MSWSLINPFAPVIPVAPTNPSLVLSGTTLTVNPGGSSVTLPASGGGYVLVDGWLGDPGLGLTTAGANKVYVVVVNGSATVKLPWPRTGLADGATFEVIIVGSGSCNLIYNGSNGLALNANSRAVFIWSNTIQRYWYVLNTGGGSSVF